MICGGSVEKYHTNCASGNIACYGTDDSPLTAPIFCVITLFVGTVVLVSDSVSAINYGMTHAEGEVKLWVLTPSAGNTRRESVTFVMTLTGCYWGLNRVRWTFLPAKSVPQHTFISQHEVRNQWSGDFKILKPMYVSPLYEQHVAKILFFKRGVNLWSMASTQKPNLQKLWNTLYPVLQAPEHEKSMKPVFFPKDRFTNLNHFTLFVYIYCVSRCVHIVKYSVLSFYRFLCTGQFWRQFMFLIDNFTFVNKWKWNEKEVDIDIEENMMYLLSAEQSMHLLS